MSKLEKLLSRLKQRPKDFTYEEAKTLLESLGFYEYNKGKTSGSRVVFLNQNTGEKVFLHKPHPSNILKKYTIKDLLDKLREIGVI